MLYIQKVVIRYWKQLSHDIDMSTTMNFISAYLNDTGVALGATNVPDTLTIGSTLLPHQLHHNVGATFNSAGSAPINKAVFASTTALAGKIAASVEMQKKVKDLLSIKKDDVVAAMRQSGKSSDWITWDAATDPSVATGFSAIHLHADWDLWYAIGDASLAGFKVSAHVLKRADGSYWADIISVQGQLLDLYDFDWDFPHLNLSSTAAGAAIQARYNAAGDPGHVFKVEVNFNNDTGVQWNF